MQALDLTSDSHVENAVRLTQMRRRLFNELIGIREMRHISQAQVARAIGINRSGISRFESDIEGSNPTMDVVLRYAHAVGASIQLRVEPVEPQLRVEARLRSVPAGEFKITFLEPQPSFDWPGSESGWVSVEESDDIYA